MRLIGLGRPANQDACVVARRMFERVLAAWAVDVLELRRIGLDRPGHRVMESDPIGSPLEPAASPDWECW